MLASANRSALAKAGPIAAAARQDAETRLTAEIVRIEDLATRNPAVPQAEIDALRDLRARSLAAMENPRLRLDALRLIWKE